MKFQNALDRFLQQYPALTGNRAALEAAFVTLTHTYENGGKLLLCGNGGSAADCEHIAGELMKGFAQRRPLPAEVKADFYALPHGAALADRLQGTLRAISLVSQTGLISAFANDVDPAMVYAQQVLGYGDAGDTLLALSTSGNSENVVLAAETAKARGLRVIAITGEAPGSLCALSDVALMLPAQRPKDVQELTLPVYHFLCLALEDRFFAP